MCSLRLQVLRQLHGVQVVQTVQRLNMNFITTKGTYEKPTSYRRKGVSFADASRRNIRKKSRTNTIKEFIETFITLPGKFDETYRYR